MSAAKVALTPLVGLYPHIGIDDISYPQNPCELPLVFSGLLQEDLQKMTEIIPSHMVSKRHGVDVFGIITYEDVLKTPFRGPLEPGAMDGQLFNHVRAPKVGKILLESKCGTVQQCKHECEARKTCKSYNFSFESSWEDGEMVKHGICQLMDHITGTRPMVGVESGVILDRYTCFSH
jgi:PAN domain